MALPRSWFQLSLPMRLARQRMEECALHVIAPLEELAKLRSSRQREFRLRHGPRGICHVDGLPIPRARAGPVDGDALTVQ